MGISTRSERTMQTATQAPPPLSDAELAVRIAAGDHQAFERLMRRYNRQLYRTARSILRDDTEAEDALQDAYLLAYRGMANFRGEANLSTWLTRIVINEAIGRARKNARRAEIIDLDGQVWAADDSQGGPMDYPADTEGPDQAALRAEARRLLERKIDALPSAFRTVFMLRALEEMTVEETADCLQIPEATVRSRYFRARGMLRESLAQEIDHAFDAAFSFDGARCDRIVARTLERIAGTPDDLPPSNG